jgi:hypothetical protein
VLLRQAASIEDVDEGMTAILTAEVIADIVDWVPEAWLSADPGAPSATQMRESYRRYLVDRLDRPRTFVEEVTRAR